MDDIVNIRQFLTLVCTPKDHVFELNVHTCIYLNVLSVSVAIHTTWLAAFHFETHLLVFEKKDSRHRFEEVRGGKSQASEAMVLSGLALELGAGRLSSAQMLKPQATARRFPSRRADWVVLVDNHTSFARPNSGYRTEMRKSKESFCHFAKGRMLGMRYDGFGYAMYRFFLVFDVPAANHGDVNWREGQ